MPSKQAFKDYLISKHRNEASINDSLQSFDKFYQFLDESGLKNLSDFTQDTLFSYIKPNQPDNRRGAIEKANNFALDLAAAIHKEFYDEDEPGAAHMAAEIDAYFLKQYEDTAKYHAEQRLKNFLPPPKDFKVNPALLQGLTNRQYVSAFHTLHNLLQDIYAAIAHDPFRWGYPNYLTTDGYYNRVNDILYVIALCGAYKNGGVTVDAKQFFAHKNIKRHKKIAQTIDGFRSMGFDITGFDKKAATFTVFFPQNPHVMTVLHGYFSQTDKTLQDWAWGVPRNSLSYRFVEDPAVQTYEDVFLAEMDYFSENMQKVQRLLHGEAAKYGYAIDRNEWLEKGMMLYKKGVKRFLLVGERDGAAVSKAIFRTVFDTHPAEIAKLTAAFPGTFATPNPGACHFCDVHKQQTKPCSMRISYQLVDEKRHNCAYNSFWFKGVTPDNLNILLDLFKAENKIK